MDSKQTTSKNVQSTLKFHEQFIEDGGSTDSVLAVALEAHESGNLDQAEILYNRIIRDEPNHFIACHQLGVLNNQRRRFSDAVDILNKAILINPRSSLAHLNLGIAFENINDIKQALKHYKLSLFFNTKQHDAMLNISAILAGLGMNQEALLQLEKYNYARPDSFEGHFNQGLVLQNLNRYEESLHSLNIALKLNPSSLKALEHRNQALIALAHSRNDSSEFINSLDTHLPMIRDLGFQYWKRVQEAFRGLDLCAVETALNNHAADVPVDFSNPVSISLTFYRLGPQFSLQHMSIEAWHSLIISRDKMDEHLPSQFITALYNISLGDSYVAAHDLFDWLRSDKEEFSIYFLKGVSDIYHPSFKLINKISKTVDQKINLLVSCFDCFKNLIQGNDLSNCFIEAISLALSKYYGTKSEFEKSQLLLETALNYIQSPPRHLRSALHATKLKLAQKQVPVNLQKFIGETNNHLHSKFCTIPFTDFHVGPNGLSMLCCGHLLPETTGDISDSTNKDVLNTEHTIDIRRSIAEGNFKYCDHLNCPYLFYDSLEDRDNLSADEIVYINKYEIKSISTLYFGIDQSCNLSCPSCRTGVFVAKDQHLAKLMQATEKTVLPLLPKLKRLEINPAGELFLSRPSRLVLENLNSTSCPNLSVYIISNGTLFSETEWNKWPNLHDMIFSVRISLDAANKDTFEKLRRGARWDVVLNNLKFISKLRQSNTIKKLMFSFTYQLDNFKEMIEFVDFSRQLSCDTIIFEKLQNMGTFSFDEFTDKAVHLPDHPLYSEFLNIISNPLLSQNFINRDSGMSLDS